MLSKHMRTPVLAVLALSTLAVAAQPVVEFPAGTTRFFDSRVSDAIPAEGGGVWAATPDGVVRYTEAGPGTAYPVPGGRPYHLAMAGDGSIWVANATLIARMSTDGVILEQYPTTGVRDLAVATDASLWYLRSGSFLGRIATGTVTEFPATEAWSLAPAPDGDIWFLNHGLGTVSDDVRRTTAAGVVTVIPLGHDVLFGRVQSLADGTLFVGTGIRRSVLRLAPGAETFEVIPLPDSDYLADHAGNLWTGGHGWLGYIGRSGSPVLNERMPGDPRNCTNIPAWFYAPMAIDLAGDVWIRIYDGAAYLPLPLPCEEPAPPPMPDFIRVDASTFLQAHAGHDIPTLSLAMLIAFAAAIVAATLWRMRA